MQAREDLVPDIQAIQDTARRIRIASIKMTAISGASHVSSCLSISDILAVLYGAVLNVDPTDPALPSRDRFVVSKGHAAAAIYATLAFHGFIPESWLMEYCSDGSPLVGHVTHHGVPGVELSTGSLGHGLPISVGLALACKRQGGSYRCICLLSDGECDEGSNWEAALFAAHFKLDNLTAIIDYNKIQSLKRVEDTIALEPLADKWRAFGWEVKEVDGHDTEELFRVLSDGPTGSAKPTCVIAHTVKGKGVSFMEDEAVLWHYRSANDEELRAALLELGGA